MKRILLRFAVAGMFVMPTVTGAPAAYLLNGDRVSARYAGQRGGDSLFEVPWRNDPLVIPTRYLGSAMLSDGVEMEAPDAWVGLTNGDRFPVELTAMDGKGLTVRTAWGENQFLRHDMIASLDMVERGTAPAYRGPGAPGDWAVRPNQPTPLNLASLAPGPDGLHVLQPATMSRLITPPPGPYRIRMRLRHAEPSLHVTLNLTEPGTSPGAPRRHTFIFSERAIYYRYMEDQGRDRTSWRIRSGGGSFFQAGESDLRVGVDPESGRCGLWLNDTLLREWDGVEAEERREAAVPLMMEIGFQQVAGPLSLASLVVEGWNPPPREPGGEARPEPEPKAGEVMLVLRNGDRLVGKDIVFRDDSFQVELEGGRVLPVASGRVSRLVFPPEDRAHPMRRPRDVRLWPDQGPSRLTAELTGMEDGTLQLRHDAFSAPLRIAVDDLRAVTFNPYTDHRFDRNGFREESGLKMIR